MEVSPGFPFDMDVSITSTGAKDSYLLLEVDILKIPKEISGEGQDVELFSFDIDDNAWFLVMNETANGVYSYVFGYVAVIDTLDESMAGDTVEDVADSATFYDFSSAFAWTGELEIKAYAI